MYRAVHAMVQGSTSQGPTRYKVVHGGTCQYTVSRSAFAPGRGRGGRGGGRFWCAFEIAAFKLTAPTVASASSNCMHKLVYSSPGTLASASPAAAPPFATRGQRLRRLRLAMLRQAPRQPQPQPQVAGHWRRHIPILGPTGALEGPAGGRQEGRQHVAAKRGV
jgi:hypothetical protein